MISRDELMAKYEVDLRKGSVARVEPFQNPEKNVRSGGLMTYQGAEYVIVDESIPGYVLVVPLAARFPTPVLAIPG